MTHLDSTLLVLSQGIAQAATMLPLASNLRSLAAVTAFASVRRVVAR